MEWQPISTAPVGEYVLVVLPRKQLVVVAVKNIVDDWYAWLLAIGACAIDPPTHWMPLPSPPEPPT